MKRFIPVFFAAFAGVLCGALLITLLSSSNNQGYTETMSSFFKKAHGASNIQAVNFFIGSNCPPGFAPYTAAEGRFIRGAANGDQTTGGSEFMSAGQMPAHAHGFSDHYRPGGYNVAGDSGGPDKGVDGGLATIGNGTNNAGGGGAYWQPYIQLKPCVWTHN